MTTTTRASAEFDIDASELFAVALPDDRTLRKGTPEVRARRTHFARYVKGITAGCAALCLIALVRTAFGGGTAAAADTTVIDHARAARSSATHFDRAYAAPLTRVSIPVPRAAAKPAKRR